MKKILKKFAFSKSNFIYPKYEWNGTSEEDVDRNLYSPEEIFIAGVENHHIANTAYPINHNHTFVPYKVNDIIEKKQLIYNSFGEIDEMGLYIHIPYCEKKCLYCEYTVCEKKKDVLNEDMYVDALEKEFELYDEIINFREKQIHGLDIGGGTPTFLSKENIRRVLEMYFYYSNGNTNGISVETTPKIAAEDYEKILLLKELGCERISMGLQTSSAELSKKLERDDANKNNELAVSNIRKAGFEKFNIDLMYGFPHQNVEEFAQTVKYAMGLDPEFITLYRMRYKGTKMENFKNAVFLQDVNEQELVARKLLTENGYDSIEGKNTFSKVENNSGASKYLTSRVVNGLPYLGLGLGAQSFSPVQLSYNEGAASKTLDSYLKKIKNDELPLQDCYFLSKPASIGKFSSVSFYFGQISKQDFNNLYREDFDDYFKNEIDFLESQELMINDEDFISLTKKGKQFFGGVISQFYSPSIQKYLVEKKETGEVFSWIKNEKNVLDLEEKEVEDYYFGNILFAGKCNQKCEYCVGKQVESRLNVDNLSQYPLKNIDKFIALMNRSKCNRVILTGTTSDPSLYKSQAKLIARLRKFIWDCNISIHTNGQNLTKIKHKDEYILNLYDTCSLSLPSLDPEIFFKHTGVKNVPDLEEILRIAKIPVKISCVVNEHNVNDVDNFLTELSELGIKRVAVRHLLGDEREWDLFNDLEPIRYFYGNPVYDIKGMEVTYWNFGEVTQKSLNLFGDGTISSNYLITDVNEVI